jgi:hypothetical protein
MRLGLPHSPDWIGGGLQTLSESSPYQSVRSGSTDFGQVAFEPAQVLTARKPAIYLPFCVPY